MSLNNALSTRSRKARARRVAQALVQRLGQDGSSLDAKVARAYPDGGWRAYRAAVAEAGNPADQIARFEAAGIILQPKQLEFAAWARRVDDAEHIAGEQGTPEIGMGGAKGPGKSFALFAQTAVDDCQRFAGLKALYLRRTGKRAQEQIEDLVGAVLAQVEHTYTRGRVRFPAGSQIIIGHFQHEKEALNYAGIEYDLIIIEEATTLSEKAHTALRQSARTSKAGWRPRIYNSTNPLGVGHSYYKKRFIEHERKYTNVRNRTRKFIFATVYDNRFVNDDYRGNLRDLTGVERRAYLDGDWDVSAGAYFEEWSYERHTLEPFAVPAAWQVWASMDYGFNHWNMIYLHAKNSDGVVYTFAELAHRKHYPAEIAADFRRMLGEHGIPISRVETILAGSDVFSRTGSAQKTIAEQYKSLGMALTAAQTGPGSRVGGAHYISALLGNVERGKLPRWFVTRNCARLIETMPLLERDPNRPEDVLKVDMDEGGEGGDDAYDAARYGLYRDEKKKLSARTQKYA